MVSSSQANTSTSGIELATWRESIPLPGQTPDGHHDYSSHVRRALVNYVQEREQSPRAYMFGRNVLVILAVIAIVASGVIVATTTANNNRSTLTGRFYHIADVRFDPGYDGGVQSEPCLCRSTGSGCQQADWNNGTYGRYGCNSGADMVRSGLQWMRDVYEHPDWVVVSGNSASGNLSAADTAAAVVAVMNMTAQYFPGAALFPTLGALDVHPAFCLPEAPNTWLEYVLEHAWPHLAQLEPAFPGTAAPRDTFGQGGYYAAAVPGVPGLVVVAVNSVYWDTAHTATGCSAPPPTTATPTSSLGAGETAERQLQWLEDIVRNATALRYRVLIATHSAPGAVVGAATTTWEPAYEDRFAAIVQDNRDTVVAVLTGSSGHDFFKVMYTNTSAPSAATAAVPVFVNPPMTPAYSTNPALRLFEYMHHPYQNSEITDYLQWMCPLYQANNGIVGSASRPPWELEYRFTTEYNLVKDEDTLSAASLHSLKQRIKQSPELLGRFAAHYTVSTTLDSYAFICSMDIASAEEYETCVQEGHAD